MLGEQPTGAIDGVYIHAVSHQPPTATYQGKPVQLAIITADGKVIAAGEQLSREIESAVINCYRNTLKGQGFLRVTSNPIQLLKHAA